MKKLLLVLVFCIVPFSVAFGNGGEVPLPSEWKHRLPSDWEHRKTEARPSRWEEERAAVARLIEPDATIGDFEDPNAVIRELVGLVRSYGYKCDSVSHARRLFFKPGFEIQCNNLRYTYQVVDRGGRWVVCLDKCK